MLLGARVKFRNSPHCCEQQFWSTTPPCAKTSTYSNQYTYIMKSNWPSRYHSLISCEPGKSRPCSRTRNPRRPMISVELAVDTARDQFQLRTWERFSSPFIRNCGR